MLHRFKSACKYELKFKIWTIDENASEEKLIVLQLELYILRK